MKHIVNYLRVTDSSFDVHYLLQECECKSLHYRMLNGKCKDCGHGSVQHFSHFNKVCSILAIHSLCWVHYSHLLLLFVLPRQHVLNPIKSYGYTGDGRRAMFKLKGEILDKCLLRRTKETKAEDLNLPPRLVAIRKVRLHPVEEDFYNALYTQTQSSFNDYVEEGTLLNNYAHIFDLLMRMRQAVDHPYLVVYSKRDSVREAAAGAGRAVANGSVDCDLCHEPPTDRVLSSCCQAAFCRGCVMDYMTSLLSGSDDANTPCPSCRSPFSIDLNQASTSVVDDGTLTTATSHDSSGSDVMPSLKELPHVATGSILRRINLAEYATSSKIEALVQELVQMRQTSPGSKAIVFSQFVSMIDLIRWRLHSDPCLASIGMGVRALHGSMDVKSRDASLKEFREDPNVRVLLMSLKAGGVALNLTVANHIYLMDPWYVVSVSRNVMYSYAKGSNLTYYLNLLGGTQQLRCKRSIVRIVSVRIHSAIVVRSYHLDYCCTNNRISLVSTQVNTVLFEPFVSLLRILSRSVFSNCRRRRDLFSMARLAVMLVP